MGDSVKTFPDLNSFKKLNFHEDFLWKLLEAHPRQKKKKRIIQEQESCGLLDAGTPTEEWGKEFQRGVCVGGSARMTALRQEWQRAVQRAVQGARGKGCAAARTRWKPKPSREIADASDFIESLLEFHRGLSG